MDDCRRCYDIPPLLGGSFCEEEEATGAERLREALLYATAQLESARASAHEELRVLDCRALHLAQLLESAARDRDEARRRCRSQLLLLHRHAGAGSAAAAEAELECRRRPLPEKGGLVEAVMGAGPLLQTLLLTGPLPRWQVPPPALRCHEIPPVVSPPPSASLSNEDHEEEEEERNRVRKRKRGAATSSSSSSSPESNFM